MSRQIPDTPPCAACCSRLDLIPSRFAAVLWFAWLALVCAATLFAVALPWPVRVAICIAIVVPGIRCIREFVLLEGPRAVRAIEWTEEGAFAVRLGPELTAHPATLAAGSFRLGVQLWVLRFMTPMGLCPVLITGGAQDARPFRRLTRCLTMHLRRAPGRGTAPTVTIRPKV
jgi:hypothetical protein